MNIDKKTANFKYVFKTFFNFIRYYMYQVYFMRM